MATWDMAVKGMQIMMQPLMDAAIDAINDNEGRLSDVMVRVFSSAADKAMSAVGGKFSGFFDSIGSSVMQPIANNLQGLPAFGTNADYQIYPDRQSQRSSSSSSTVNNSPTYVINGAQDPKAVAQEVMRIQEQEMRLGVSGSRLF